MFFQNEKTCCARKLRLCVANWFFVEKAVGGIAFFQNAMPQRHCLSKIDSPNGYMPRPCVFARSANTRAVALGQHSVNHYTNFENFTIEGAVSVVSIYGFSGNGYDRDGAGNDPRKTQ